MGGGGAGDAPRARLVRGAALDGADAADVVVLALAHPRLVLHAPAGRAGDTGRRGREGRREGRGRERGTGLTLCA